MVFINSTHEVLGTVMYLTADATFGGINVLKKKDCMNFSRKEAQVAGGNTEVHTNVVATRSHVENINHV